MCKNFWIREGCGVKAVYDTYHDDADVGLKLDLYVKNGVANYDDVVTVGQHVARTTDEKTVKPFLKWAGG